MILLSEPKSPNLGISGAVMTAAKAIPVIKNEVIMTEYTKLDRFMCVQKTISL